VSFGILMTSCFTDNAVRDFAMILFYPWVSDWPVTACVTAELNRRLRGPEIVNFPH